MLAGANERHRVPNALRITGTVARHPDPSPSPNLGWSDDSAKGLKGFNKGPTTVDASGKILTGKIESVTGEGVWRVPVEGLRKDKKGRAIALIPNTVSPAAPDKDKNVRVDVLLHLHGFGAGYRELKPGESDYTGVLKPGELRDVDLYQVEQQLLSHVKTSKKLLIAVLPQGSDRSNLGDLSSNSNVYLKEVFDKLVPTFLPKGATPGCVTASGHSGGGPTALEIAKQRSTERTDVLLFDAINYVCKERVPVIKDGKPVVDKDGTPKTECKDNICVNGQFTKVRDWVRAKIDADIKNLPEKPADQKAELQAKGTRFRGFTSGSLESEDTCGYGFWYGQLKSDIKTTIRKLAISEDAKNQLRQNY